MYSYAITSIVLHSVFNTVSLNNKRGFCLGEDKELKKINGDLKKEE